MTAPMVQPYIRAMSKHTPGPWRYATTGEVMCGYGQPLGVAQEGKPNLVAGIFGDVSGGLPTADANARLIAAAPELLAGAMAMMAVRERVHSHKGSLTRGSYEAFLADEAKATALLRAAIAKAEGE